MVDGVIQPGHAHRLRRAPTDVYEVDEVGYLQLGQLPADELEAGRGRLRRRQHREVRDTRVGRHHHGRRTTAPPSCCPATSDVKSMVFAGIYPTDADQYEDLRDALEKLQLNDA